MNRDADKHFALQIVAKPLHGYYTMSQKICATFILGITPRNIA